MSDETEAYLDHTKVLFLDIDGVLNNDAVMSDRRFGVTPLDHLCVQLLHEVVRATKCYVVLSSSWRDMEMLEAKLHGDRVFEFYIKTEPSEFPQAKNFRHTDGSTKRLRMFRGEEIQEWLSRHPEVKRYAIIDDDSDMLDEQKPYFVRTNTATGMKKPHANRLIDILNANV